VKGLLSNTLTPAPIPNKQGPCSSSVMADRSHDHRFFTHQHAPNPKISLTNDMEETEDHIAIKVQALGDLELAVLICLVAEQHCIIEAEKNLINDVGEELQLVSGSV
jgi:hypothetical protein